METVIDTSSVHALLENPVTRMAQGNSVGTLLDEYIEKGRIKVVLDSHRGIQSEWERTCGIDQIQVLITYWAEVNGLMLVTPNNSLGRVASNRLRALGFKGAIDKLLVRTAVATKDRQLVSEDGDFWDPKDSRNRGKNDGPVAVFLKEEFSIDVYLLQQLLENFEK